jgi:GAF domain-containing protein
MDPTRSREERSRGIAPASRWAWNARLIPGFLLTQVALLPLAGGSIFVSLVTDFGPGSPYSVILWVVAAGGAGVIAERLRRSDEERARAIARERLAANQLHRLQAVTGSLASAMSAEEVATAVISTAMAALGADAGGLTVRTDDPTTLKVLASSTHDPSLLGVWREHSIERPLPATEIVRTGKPIFIETRRELLSRFPIVKRIERDQRFGAFAGVPVTLGDETLGALALGFMRDHMVPPEQRGLLTAVAHQAAIALQRIRFEEDERRARATAEQAEDRLRKLQSVTDAANAAVGLDDMLKSVLPLVMGAMLADGTSFLLLSEDGSELTVEAALGAEEEGVEPTPIPLGTGASGRIAATGRPLVIADLTPEDVINPALRNRRSYVGVPMRIGGKVAGVLHASSARHGVFDEDDADFLQSVTDSLAVTLDRGRLFDQRDRMATALERALLPMSLPNVPGFEVATMYRPSHFGDEVGGDFYDVFGDGDVWYLATCAARVRRPRRSWG